MSESNPPRRPRPEPGPHRPPSPGLAVGIRADELLPLRALRERLGWGERTIAQAQRDGLRVISYGRWKYVLGADVLAWFAGLGNATRVDDRQAA